MLETSALEGQPVFLETSTLGIVVFGHRLYSGSFKLVDQDGEAIQDWTLHELSADRYRVNRPWSDLEFLLAKLTTGGSPNFYLTDGEGKWFGPLILSFDSLGSIYDPLVSRARFGRETANRSGVAVLTRFYNESNFLVAWQRFYSQYVGTRNLFLVDDGSQELNTGDIFEGVNLIRLPRIGLDHWNLAFVMGYLQRMLLHRYEWTIQCDLDEWLYFKRPFEDYFRDLTGPAIIQPKHLCAVVHDHESEPPFNFSEPRRSIKEIRKVIVAEDEMYRKPLISNQPVTWGPGFHYCSEPTTVSDDLLLLHSKFIDRMESISKARAWSQVEQSSLDKSFFKRPAEVRDVGDSHYVGSEFALYASRERIPEEILKKFEVT